MKAIVIATTKGREEWVKQCLESLRGYTNYPVIVVDQYDWELGKIMWVYLNTCLDEFIFLQDSVVVKDYAWLDEAFEHEGSVSFGSQPFFMYLGKYTREDLDNVELPFVHSKLDSVRYEGEWTAQYKDRARNVKYMLNNLDDTDVFEDHFGRKNMILENEHIKKYKGTWSKEMIL